ncbi:hypothetical protein M569_16939, partial [Genlisea aurea]
EADSDSDAPEEFTSQQGMRKDEEIREVIRENKARVVHERKERRRKRLLKLTPRNQLKKTEEQTEIKTHGEESLKGGALPEEIVRHIAVQEKKLFETDDNEDDDDKKTASKRRRRSISRLEPIILKELKSDRCVQNSLAFLRERKMKVPRSSSVLRSSKR